MYQQNAVTKIRKRDGSIEDFDLDKIVQVVYKALLSTKEGTEADAHRVADSVLNDLLAIAKDQKDFLPTVEGIQNLVEKNLMLHKLPETAKAYILYRQQHTDLRKKGLGVPDDVRKKFNESKKYFKNPLSELVYYKSYARWVEKEGRRETWPETVDRFMVFMKNKMKKRLTDVEYEKIHLMILEQDIIPSMRLIWAAGDAAKKTNVAAYNCSFVAPSCWRDFGEMAYILMCGAGVGVSVESHVVQGLPQIAKQSGKKLKTHVVADSKEGWANAITLGLSAWASGKDIDFDYSKVRPAGARLKTMGGRASGPEPLKSLLVFARQKMLAKQGRRLSNIDVHDIICKIGEVVVSGGVRRSSIISLSDLDDNEMRNAKAGQFFITEPQRSMANNSAVYTQKPTTAEFLDEWVALMKSGTGERGIFNRGCLEKQLPSRRWRKFKKYLDTAGVNPCGEIILRSKQFCNLSGIVIRPEDTRKTLLEKIKYATILGTYQALLTYFPYLSSDWQKNCKEEMLLGVSLTGYWDNVVVRNAKVLEEMRKEAIKTNRKYAKRSKIRPSTCVTCVKPSGNSSQFLDTASGMHPRFSKYYIRRVRINTTDPILKMLRDQGVPVYPEVGQRADNATTFVVEFPIKSPEGSIVKDDISAIELLEQWKLLKIHFTEHNPSATIYVGDNEWIEVADWIYRNWEIVGGLTFLPRDNHVYQLAPYEEIDKETYEKLAKIYEHVDFSKLYLYEKQDETSGAKEYVCGGGACEI